jgi:myo-inositol-1(or 4)-monophosphatase
MTDQLASREDCAIRVAREAGALLQCFRRGSFEIGFKGKVDLVTEADQASERLITESILSAFPRDGILAEEGTVRGSESGMSWIIDPLDGTTNFSHGFPVYSVSIGLQQEGVMIFGAVYDPTRDEMFLTSREGRPSLNGSPIEVSKTDSLERSLLVTGFPYDVRTSVRNNLDYFSRFTLEAQAVRRTGSAALDLCYVASGRFDGFWELKLHPWDTAAGWLIVSQAGGCVTDLEGNPFNLESDAILASNGLIHQAMIDTIRA